MSPGSRRALEHPLAIWSILSGFHCSSAMASFPSGQKVTILQASSVPAPRHSRDLLACGTFQPRLLKEQLGGPVVTTPPRIHPSHQHPGSAHLGSRPWGWSHPSSQLERPELTPHKYHQLWRLHQRVLILYYLQVFDQSWMRSDTARLVLLVGAQQGRKSLWMG